MNRNRSPRGSALPAAGLVLGIGAAVVLAAGLVLGRSTGAGTPATPDPSPVVTPGPSDRPSVPPPAKPTDPPQDGVTKVDLDIATDHDVAVIIRDETGKLIDARSGRASDGMSVRWYVLKVENVDESTLRLTWVGFGADDDVDLYVGSNGGNLRLRMVQPGPPPQSDAVGFDRVLILRFDEPVDAADVQASIQDSLDTGD
jgi:hypothetical protein